MKMLDTLVPGCSQKALAPLATFLAAANAADHVEMTQGLAQLRADRPPHDPREIRGVVRGEGKREHDPLLHRQSRGARAEDERGNEVRDDGDRGGEDGDGADDEKRLDLAVLLIRWGSAREHLAGFHAIAPALSKVRSGKRPPAMKH